MPKRSSNLKKDLNKLASSIVGQAIGEAPTSIPASVDEGKNPAAVALGRLGGLKGGKARAAKMTKSERQDIAKKAAKARWRKKDHSNT